MSYWVSRVGVQHAVVDAVQVVGRARHRRANAALDFAFGLRRRGLQRRRRRLRRLLGRLRRFDRGGCRFSAARASAARWRAAAAAARRGRIGGARRRVRAGSCGSGIGGGGSDFVDSTSRGGGGGTSRAARRASSCACGTRAARWRHARSSAIAISGVETSRHVMPAAGAPGTSCPRLASTVPRSRRRASEPFDRPSTGRCRCPLSFVVK